MPSLRGSCSKDRSLNYKFYRKDMEEMSTKDKDKVKCIISGTQCTTLRESTVFTWLVKDFQCYKERDHFRLISLLTQENRTVYIHVPSVLKGSG